MDAALNSPINVQQSPTLACSSPSSALASLSPILNTPTSNLHPPTDNNMSASEPSSPITAPESPSMPDATSTQPISDVPASPAAVDGSANSSLTNPSLLSLRTYLVEELQAGEQRAQVRTQELVTLREQLVQVRAELRQLQEQHAANRSQPVQVSESLDSDSNSNNHQGDSGLGVQDTQAESPAPSPDSQAAAAADAPVGSEDTVVTRAAEEDLPQQPPGNPVVDTAPPVTGPSADESQEDPQLTNPVDDPVQSSPPVAPDETSTSPPPLTTDPELPEWVDIEEDTSAPDEEELKEIEAANDVSARDVKYHEESFYAGAPEDPEQQPLHKMRLTWTIKGVRGTKENPNRARIMNSPSVYVGGYYWYLKFFPRGNNSSALSAYVKCSRKERKPDKEVPENTFCAVYGDADANLGELEPAIDMSIPATATATKSESKSGCDEANTEETLKKSSEGESVPHDESANASDDPVGRSAVVEQDDSDEEDWRVSAQIGIIIYNPDEPRTKFDMYACHQFNKHNDDWGWTNFHGPWSEIHKRRHGQRQALLRNDTLALDAYVRIFNDPSQWLWWHHCDTEEQWDSVSLAGYPAIGTSNYHYPGVAAITSWLLLAPFRKIFQKLSLDPEHKDSLCSQLQIILYLMRKQRKEEKLVSLDPVFEKMNNLGESGTDAVTFWERFRRSLELELEFQPAPEALDQIADIFDGQATPDAKAAPTPPLKIPVQGVASVQAGLEQTLSEASSKQRFPKFLAVELERQKFDTTAREWKLSYDRVRLSEELDLSQWSTEPQVSGYTLYGFIVHVDERNSGEFYSILRPNGPGSKWLAFDSGSRYQVVSHTSHRILDFEGLEGDPLAENKALRQTAYLAMYIRTDLLAEFLPGKLEPFDLSPQLRDCRQVRDKVDNKENVEACEEEGESELKVKIYASDEIDNLRRLIDITNSKDAQPNRPADDVQNLTLPTGTTYQKLRQQLAECRGVDNVERIKMWVMQPPTPKVPLNSSSDCFLSSITRLNREVSGSASAGQSLHIWIHVLASDEEVKSFGDPEPLPVKDVSDENGAGDDSQEQGEGDSVPAEGDLAPASSSAVETDARGDEVVEEAAEGSSSTPPVAVTLPVSGSANDQTSNTREESEASAAAGLEMMSSGEGASAEPLDNPEVPAASTTPEVSTTPEATSAQSNAVSAEAADPQVGGEAVVSAEQSAREINEAPPQPAPSPSSRDSGGPTGSTTANAEPDAIISEDVARIRSLITPNLGQPDDTAGATPRPNDALQPASVRDGDEEIEAATDDAAIGTDMANAAAPEDHDPSPSNDAETAPAPAPATGSNDAGQRDNEVDEDDNDEDEDDEDDDYDAGAHSDSTADDYPDMSRPIPFFYGFIQLFDAQEQSFTTHGDIIAQRGDKVKDVMRMRLGYPDDKQFLVWRRVNAYRLTSIQASSTFDEIQDSNSYAHDGTVLVVGDVLSDTTKSSLTAASSFQTPEALSQYLWYSARRHPVQAHTGEITISSFGLDYYSGSLVKGLYCGLGTHITTSGHSYTGPFLAGSRSTSSEHPEGTCTYSNGDTYIGGWSNNEKHGQGSSVEKRTGNRYVGGYQDGKRWGKGTTYWEVADEEGEMCQICYSEGEDALFFDCGHVCACVECAKQVDVCPICRKTVKEVVKIWKA